MFSPPPASYECLYLKEGKNKTKQNKQTKKTQDQDGGIIKLPGLQLINHFSDALKSKQTEMRYEQRMFEQQGWTNQKPGHLGQVAFMSWLLVCFFIHSSTRRFKTYSLLSFVKLFIWYLHFWYVQRLWTPDHHTHMRVFPKLLPQSWKHTIV
ncbi:hypothetical protein PGIGA_G00062040 [Pangasianodon gigas]|uniref:Uncharacterized protein n=1 Tax=Pangasianodon gigas TaxID=30993 RepID=A0ACC5X510_PANGG|nr:hypothetical protein [Pangasianodon gigas]